MREWLARQFELSRGGAGHNVRSMEGLRGFAVFLVFLVHYATLVNPWVLGNAFLHSFASAVHTMGNAGVDLFFVLSGYLIYGSLISRSQNFMRFMMRRVRRIYPAFIAVLVIYIGLSFVFPAENKIPSALSSASVYLLQNFLLLPGLFPIEPLVTVSWSLSYEMFYYLAIPLLILFLDLRRRDAKWRVVFFSLVTAAVAAYCAFYGGHVRLIMFVSGILLHEALAGRSISPPGSVPAVLALAAGLFSTILPVPGSAGYVLKIVILFAAFFTLCFTCFGHQSAWLPKAFSWTPLRWLGNMSYSYYLLHGLALKSGFLVLSKILGTAGSGVLVFWGMLPLMFALTLIPSIGLFLLVERPFSLAPALEARKPLGQEKVIYSRNSQTGSR